MDIASERAYPTPFVNSSLLPMLLLSLAQQRHSPRTSSTFKEEYDYIIVGAGAAGAVVASRLSEIPCVSVLLLEAGKPPPLLTEVPGISGSFGASDIAWSFRTVPQKYCGSGLVDRTLSISSGKALGGSTIINGMLYVRGNKKDYDNWAEMGATGWAYKDVYPYFLKLEDNQDEKYLMNGFHSTRGPITFEVPKYDTEFTAPVLEEGQRLGYTNFDPNAYSQTGIYKQQATERNYQRCSTAKAYLVPAENRTNLDILANARVTKIVMDGTRAVGVEFNFNNITSIVMAKREVIVSAGTVHTPQLLMLSGIGPKEHLEDLKIPVIADLPVGDNFHNHVSTIMDFQINARRLDDKFRDPANIQEYINNRTGPLSGLATTALSAYLGEEPLIPDFPTYQLYFVETTSEDARAKFGLKPEVYQQVYGPYEKQALYGCQAVIMRPKSRGTIRLQSTDPYDDPLIDPNFFEDPRDIKVVVEALKMCQKIGNSEPLKKIGSKPFTTLYPGCEQYGGDDDSYFECQTRTAPMMVRHPVGSAKMGDVKDPTTVVDPNLRVKGIDGLRVVDASIMPSIITGNTYIPTVMIAEKASDIIKETLLST